MIDLSSRHHPLVAVFRAVARAKADGDDRLLLDGAHLVAEALRSGIRLQTVAMTAKMAGGEEGRRLARDAARHGAELVQVTESVMEAMSPVKTPSGIVALAERPAASLEAVLARPPQLVVAAFDVQEPGNVGAVLRAAEAFGATGVAFAGQSADPFGWKALRGSMGSALRLPVVSRVQPDALVAAARDRGVRIAATLPRGGQSPRLTDLRGPLAILLGGEGPGLPPDIVEAADLELTVPMNPVVESLNVAVAAALLLYEAANQRRPE